MALVSVVLSDPKPCHSPDVFEAHAYQFDYQLNDFIRARFSQDASMERISIFEEFRDSEKRDVFHNIRLFREKMEYHINLKDNSCKSKAIPDDEHFRRIGVPESATFIAEAEIGSNAERNAGVLIHLWVDQFTDGSNWMGQFAAHDCFPIHERVNTTQYGVIQTDFFDITLGISDPNVFIPPSGC